MKIKVKKRFGERHHLKRLEVLESSQKVLDDNQKLFENGQSFLESIGKPAAVVEEVVRDPDPDAQVKP